MYFRVNLKMKMKKPRLLFYMDIFTELNFTVAFLLIRKTWMTDLPVRWEGMGDVKKLGES